MIENLNELVKNGGVKKMHLTIESTSQTRVAVTIQCILGAEPNDPSEEQRALRQALSQPILVEGITGEVDAKLDELLTDYVRTVTPHVDSLVTNVEIAKKQISAAGKSAKLKQKPIDGDTDSPSDKQSSEADEDFATDDASSL